MNKDTEEECSTDENLGCMNVLLTPFTGLIRELFPKKSKGITLNTKETEGSLEIEDFILYAGCVSRKDIITSFGNGYNCTELNRIMHSLLQKGTIKKNNTAHGIDFEHTDTLRHVLYSGFFNPY